MNDIAVYKMHEVDTQSEMKRVCFARNSQITFHLQRRLDNEIK